MVDVTFTVSPRSAIPPTDALADFCKKAIQLSSGTPLLITWYNPLASSSRTTGMLFDNSATCPLSLAKSSPLFPAIVLAAFMAALKLRLSSVTPLRAPEICEMALVTLLAAITAWLKLTKAAFSFWLLVLAESSTRRNSSAVEVAVTNCSLPSTTSLTLNFISFAIFSAYK